MNPLCPLLLLGATHLGQMQHVVVVVLDDVGIDKVTAYGAHPTAGPTPVLDALARQGLLFRNAYAEPLCSSSRCDALTGLYGSRTGIGVAMNSDYPQSGVSGPFAPSDTLPWLPRLLLAGGVRSQAAGKWHLTNVGVPDYHLHPIRCGFDWHRGHLWNITGSESVYAWPKNIAGGTSWSESTVTTFVTFDNAIEACDALVGSAGRRSFVWLAFNAPHTPWGMLPPAGYYRPVAGPQTPAIKEQYALEAVDTVLGQLMSAYARARPDDAAKTLWIIVSDNGTPGSAVESPWPANQQKGTLYQGGVHVPLIVAGAGVDRPGREVDHLVHIVDLWKTVLDLFQVLPPPGRSDSISFAPAILDASAPPARRAVYVREHEPNGPGPYLILQEAATDGHWKLIRRTRTPDGPDGPPDELFQLDSDPFEQVNLWPPDSEAERAAVEELQKVIDAASVN